MENRLNWLIIGAGAIGTYIGGSLMLHGQKVTFIDQTKAAEHIREQGLCLNINSQEHRLLHTPVFATLSEALSHASFDVAVLAVKSFDTAFVLENIRRYASEFPPVLCLQNGVENEAALEAVLGSGKVIAGTVTSAVRRRGPGDIILERLRGMGIASTHPLSARIVAALSAAGLNAHLFTSPSSMKWSKMLTNLIANASSAILDMPPGEIMRHPGLYAVEIAQLREAINVCRAHHISIIDLPRTPVRTFAWLVYNLPVGVSRLILSRIIGRGRGDKMPSFHIDLHSGRGKSEVDYLNGAVVRFGARLGIPTPVNQWLNSTLLGLTRGELPAGEYTRQPDKFLTQLSSSSGKKFG